MTREDHENDGADADHHDQNTLGVVGFHYAVADVRYLQGMQRTWGGVRYDGTVLRVSRERVRK